MSDFKFVCPHCTQSLEASTEYVGMQINCPTCQGVIVVPQPEEEAPPPPHKAGKYSMAPSTVQHTATSPAQATNIVRQKKKPNIKLYASLAAGALAIAAAIYFGPGLVEKFQQHQKDVAAAKEAVEHPPPPPPPPDLEANEIVKRLGEAYKSFPSYSTLGESVGNIDMSEITPALKDPVHSTASLSVLLGRAGNNYKIEWERELGPRTLRGAAWSSGQGDFVRTGTATTKMKNWQSAFNTATASSGTLGVGLAELFFGGTNSAALALKDYSKLSNETLDGRKCYVLSGKIGPQKMKLWIHKDDFLIAQAELVLGGKIDDSMTAGMTLAQKAQLDKMSKMKGSIIETYSDIQTNKVLNADAFQVAAVQAPIPKPNKSDQPKSGRKRRPQQ